jgi:hypothetical protein
MKVIEVSTAHITEKDNNELYRMCEQSRDSDFYLDTITPFNIGEFQYGFGIVLSTEKEFFDGCIADCILHYEMSDSFYSLLRYAFDNGYRFLYIDRDADVIEGLQVNDW